MRERIRFKLKWSIKSIVSLSRSLSTMVFNRKINSIEKIVVALFTLTENKIRIVMETFRKKRKRRKTPHKEK